MAKRKAKILVVDDNSGIRAALKVLLPLHFSQVELILSPKELLTKLADFRQDLYYRINTFELHLPALRERTDEIIPLAEMFIKKFAEKYR